MDDAPATGVVPPLPCDARGAAALDVTLASDVSLVEPVVAAVVARCEAHGWPERVCRLHVPVALTEAIANAVVSGNGADPAKVVRVRACVDAVAVVLEVTDQGGGFDLAEDAATGEEEDFLEREGGRGLFLMQRLMDRVEQWVAPGVGSVVRMTLGRGGAARAPGGRVA